MTNRKKIEDKCKELNLKMVSLVYDRGIPTREECVSAWRLTIQGDEPAFEGDSGIYEVVGTHEEIITDLEEMQT